MSQQFKVVRKSGVYSGPVIRNGRLVVIAWFNGDGQIQVYSTHWQDQENTNNVYWGRYFSGLEAAFDDLVLRMHDYGLKIEAVV